MSASFTNQVMAQMELFANADAYENEVYVLPKHLDEKVARLHLTKIGAQLTKLTPEQADYLGLNVDGPYKAGSLPLLGKRSEASATQRQDPNGSPA